MVDPVILKSLLDPSTDLSALPWQPFRVGIEIILLSGKMTDGQVSALLRYAPGAKLQTHLHVGFEHILILRGSQHDERGTIEAGTLAINPPGSRHTVFSESGCVALLVWEKPVVFEL